MKIPPDLLTDPERKAYRRGHTDALARRGRQGATARNKSLTPERRSEIARRAVAAREAKRAANA